MTRLGIVGLGDMGGAIAEGVLGGRWDDEVTVVGYDISVEAMERFIGLGGVPASSVLELARQVEVGGGHAGRRRRDGWGTALDGPGPPGGGRRKLSWTAVKRRVPTGDRQLGLTVDEIRLYREGT